MSPKIAERLLYNPNVFRLPAWPAHACDATVANPYMRVVWS